MKKWIQVSNTLNERILINSESIIKVQEDKLGSISTCNIQLNTVGYVSIIPDITTSYEDIINQIIYEKD